MKKHAQNMKITYFGIDVSDVAVLSEISLPSPEALRSFDGRILSYSRGQPSATVELLMQWDDVRWPQLSVEGMVRHSAEIPSGIRSITIKSRGLRIVCGGQIVFEDPNLEEESVVIHRF